MIKKNDLSHLQLSQTKISLLIFLLTLTLSNIQIVVAQNIRASLNATSIVSGRGNNSVDFSTGIMNYRIPLVQLKQGGKEISVGVSYSGKGIKVEQPATVVGLGWSLNATGVVTRTIRGLEDESEIHGFLHYPIPTDPTQLAAYKKKVNKREVDGEADLFTLSYQSLNIRFVLEKITGTYLYKAVPLEKTNVKIEVEQLMPDGTPTWQIMGFKVTDESGDVYIFRDQEILLAYFKQESTGSQIYINGKTNAWYLTEIKEYKGEKINFEYEDDFLSENKLLSGAQMDLYGKRWVEYGKNDSIARLIDLKMADISLEQERINSIHRTMSYILESIRTYNSELNQLNENVLRNIYDDEKLTFKSDVNQAFGGDSYRTLVSISLDILISKFQLLKNSPDSNPLFDAYEQQLESLLSSYWTTPVYSDAIEYPILNISGMKVKLLKRIKLRNSEVLFNYKPVTTGDENKMFLEELQVLDSYADIVQRISLEYSYLENDNAKSYLKKIKIKGSQSEQTQAIYGFEYFNESEYLHKENQDFWGFPNGGGTLPGFNESLLPVEWKWANNSFYYPTEQYKWIEEIFNAPASILPAGAYDWGMTPEFVGGSRSPSINNAVTRSLKKISLPGGGNLQFEYELNTINSRFEEHSYGTPVTTPKVLTVGGLRIKKVTENDGMGNNYVKTYKYEFIPAIGSTALSTGFNVKEDKQSFSINVDYASGIKHDIIFSSSPYDFSCQIEDTGNENIFYSYVEEAVEGIGRTGYKYLQFNATSSDRYPYWLERILLAKTSYDESGNLKSLDRFKYQGSYADLSGYIGSDYLNNRFMQVDQYMFSDLKGQYRAFPYKSYDENTAGYFPTTGPLPYYNPYENYYQPNIEPRIDIANEPTHYYVATGGRILLNEIESFIFPSHGYGSELVPGMSVGNTALDFNWLFGGNYDDFLISKHIYYYDNPDHTFATRIEAIGSEGIKTLVKHKYNADYLNTAGPFMAELKTANIWNEEIEEQNWVYSTSENQWKFVAGQLNTYSPIVLDADVSPIVTRILPVSTFASELDHPVSPGTSGWNESLSTLPPYTTINHENSQIYINKLISRHWETHPWGIMLEGESKSDELVNDGVVTDMVSAYPRFSVKGCSRDEIELLDFGRIGNEQYTTIKKPINSSGIGFGSPLYDHVGYIQKIAKGISLMEISVYSSAYDYPLFRAVDSLILFLSNPREYSEFSELTSSLWTNYNSTSSSDLSLIVSYCQPYFDFDQLLYQLLPISAGDDTMLSSLFRNRNYIVTPTGGQDLKILLSRYKLSNNRVQLSSLLPFSITYKVIYNDGTPTAMRTISNSEFKNGYHVSYISMTDIPNYLNATALVYPVKYMANSPGTILIAPEGAEYQYFQYDGNKLLFTMDQRGNRNNYYYDDFNRVTNITDKDDNIIKQLKYNQVNEITN